LIYGSNGLFTTVFFRKSVYLTQFYMTDDFLGKISVRQFESPQAALHRNSAFSIPAIPAPILPASGHTGSAPAIPVPG